MRQFTQKTLVTGDTRLASAPVWMGKTAEVGLAPDQDISALLPILAVEELTYEVAYDGPIAAPIAQGDELAELIITIPGLDELRRPLFATENVEAGGLVKRVQYAAEKIGQDYLGLQAAN